MATKKRYKKLTNAEKKLNKEIRAELRQEGILPPVKLKLNRKRFAKEVIEEWQAHGSIFYLPKAIGFILPSVETKEKISPEQVGVLKVLKLAMEYEKFESDLAAKGETEYKVMELYKNVVAPILNL